MLKLPKQKPKTESIGTKNESCLHRMLKFRYTGPEGKTEAEIGGYVADGISADGEYIEVQTGSFAPLKEKAVEFARRGRLLIIHPVIFNKYIEVLSKRGKYLYRRKSPRKGSAWDLFKALVYAPQLPLIPRLCIELVPVDIEEIRVQDGKGSWRRKGLSIKDRKIIAWHEPIRLTTAKDYLRFVPFPKGEDFTVAMLAETAGIPTGLAGKTLYVLAKLNIAKRVGKRKNAFVYNVNNLARWVRSGKK